MEGVVFSRNMFIAFGREATRAEARITALSAIIAVTLVHGLTPRAGVRIMSFLSIFKILILAFIVLAGWAVLLGFVKHIEDPWLNFRHPFKDSSTTPSDYAWALYKTLNSFIGWSNASYVLGEVKNPVPTIKRKSFT